MKPAWRTPGVEALALALLACASYSQSVSPVPVQSKPAAGMKVSLPVRIPAGPAGKSIRLGQSIFDYTPRYAPKYVGNQMNCADCHLQSGRAPYSSPMVGLAHIFPTYNERAGGVIPLFRRIQQCFARSENGRPPALDSTEMKALLAYIGWLSPAGSAGQAPHGRGLKSLPKLHGDASRGAAIYTRQCAACHGADGAGVPPILPPLWGPGSYNDGAGMSRVDKMAAFVRDNMPQNAPGTLTPQEAYDVAAYINSKPRPKMNPAYAKY